MRKWWKEAVAYQIYPISFYDSNGDGMGDLNGITEKLDYLKDLGIDVIWISPYFTSPYVDNGYDISNYKDIDSRFGSFSDWENMIEKIHKKGMKLMMDLVVNHSSNQHFWFQEALKGKDNPYRDYYIWRDPKPDGSPPNNWTSFFKGSAWEYDEKSNQYYLHLFSIEQPDLNWENPKLRNEIYDMMKFWAEKGIDGFRLDVINAYGKAEGLPDGDGKLEWAPIGFEHYDNLDSNHKYVNEMHRKVFSKYDVMTVGEAGGVSTDDAVKYTHKKRNEVNMVFQFDHVGSPCLVESGMTKFKADTYPMKKAFVKWQNALSKKGWNSLYLSNHDQPRQLSKYGNDGKYRNESAKMLATILHLQQGTPFVYQGEEIGMSNIKINDISELNDIQSISSYHEKIAEGEKTPEQILSDVNAYSRDNSRTPMQWDSSANAGFSQAEPWLKVNENYVDVNVASQLDDESSILNYYKKLIHLRKENPIVVYGEFNEIEQSEKHLFVFTRKYKRQTLLVICNMEENEIDFSVPKSLKYKDCKLYISNYDDVNSLGSCKLRPYESQAFLLK